MSVEVRRLTKAYAGGTPAVEDVSFLAPTGAITSVIGPSGAGKSTILRLLAGLETPDSGAILFAGEDVSTLPPQARGVGLVFQGYALFQHMSVRQNIAFGLDVRGRPKAETRAKVDALLELVQLQDFGARRPSELSGGQQQRVALARALAIEPKLLLLDEPFGALDARVRTELREWLLRLHDQTQLTTLLVTHDQAEALELSEHVVLMLKGRVAQAGTPSELYDRPASAEVAEFLGANRMRGLVRGGVAEVGATSISAPPGAKEGDEVDAFVRPEHVRLRPAAKEDASAAIIERLRAVGARVKVTLRTAAGERVTVDLSREEAAGLAEQDAVSLEVREAQVFVGDYSI